MLEPIKTYKAAGKTIELYPNRIEIVTNAVLFGKRQQSILLRNVAEIQEGIGKTLTIVTNDGRKQRLPIGGKSAKEFKLAIMDLL